MENNYVGKAINYFKRKAKEIVCGAGISIGSLIGGCACLPPEVPNNPPSIQVVNEENQQVSPLPSELAGNLPYNTGIVIPVFREDLVDGINFGFVADDGGDGPGPLTSNIYAVSGSLQTIVTGGKNQPNTNRLDISISSLEGKTIPDGLYLFAEGHANDGRDVTSAGLYCFVQNRGEVAPEPSFIIGDGICSDQFGETIDNSPKDCAEPVEETSLDDLLLKVRNEFVDNSGVIPGLGPVTTHNLLVHTIVPRKLDEKYGPVINIGFREVSGSCLEVANQGETERTEEGDDIIYRTSAEVIIPEGCGSTNAFIEAIAKIEMPGETKTLLDQILVELEE